MNEVATNCLGRRCGGGVGPSDLRAVVVESRA